MRKPFDVRTTTGGPLVSNDLRRSGATVGGVAAGLVLVCIATYALGAAKALDADIGLIASECHYSLIPLVPGRDAEATMTVSRRTPCQVRLRPVAGSIDDFSISDLPGHGTVVQRGWTGAVYQSDRGFRGDDSFVIAMRGKSANASATSVVRVRVVVK